jgi:uncharacterized protein (DUF1778 family)
MTAAAQKRKKPGRKDTVVNLRMPAFTRDAIDHAAEVLGKTRTAFIIESSHQQAIDVLLDKRLFNLGAAAYDAFRKALDAKPKPKAKLKALFAAKSPWER